MMDTAMEIAGSTALIGYPTDPVEPTHPTSPIAAIVKKTIRFLVQVTRRIWQGIFSAFF